MAVTTPGFRHHSTITAAGLAGQFEVWTWVVPSDSDGHYGSLRVRFDHQARLESSPERDFALQVDLGGARDLCYLGASGGQVSWSKDGASWSVATRCLAPVALSSPGPPPIATDVQLAAAPVLLPNQHAAPVLARYVRLAVPYIETYFSLNLVIDFERDAVASPTFAVFTGAF